MFFPLSLGKEVYSILLQFSIPTTQPSTARQIVTKTSTFDDHLVFTYFPIILFRIVSLLSGVCYPKIQCSLIIIILARFQNHHRDNDKTMEILLSHFSSEFPCHKIYIFQRLKDFWSTTFSLWGSVIFFFVVAFFRGWFARFGSVTFISLVGNRWMCDKRVNRQRVDVLFLENGRNQKGCFRLFFITEMNRFLYMFWRLHCCYAYYAFNLDVNG